MGESGQEKRESGANFTCIFGPSNGIDVLKLPFLEELYEKTFVVPYVLCFTR